MNASGRVVNAYTCTNIDVDFAEHQHFASSFNNSQLTLRLPTTMRVTVKRWHAVAQWRWDTGNAEQDDDGEGDVCGICRVPYEGCCPSCKMPGDDCPLSAHPFTFWIYQTLTFVSFISMGRVYTCLSHALSLKMDRNTCFETAMSNGS